MRYLRDSWTEEDILSLPKDEQDYFERKAGKLLTKQDWREDLAKALSALANSGGGHIIVGQENDGTFDGVEPQDGRTPIGHWLEQIIPNLLIYPFKAFRVHTVSPLGDSKIPAGKVVVVIDVDDSAQAPHQAAVPKDKPTYYYRTGSDSKVAPHHYLEALRTRHLGAQLLARYEGIWGVKFADMNVPRHQRWDVLAEVILQFTIENVSRQACHKWTLDWSFVATPQNRCVLEPTDFLATYPSLRDTQDETILPTRSVTKLVAIGVPSTDFEMSNTGIFFPVHDTQMIYRAISEHHVPDFQIARVAEQSDRRRLSDELRLQYEATRSTNQQESRKA